MVSAATVLRGGFMTWEEVVQDPLNAIALMTPCSYAINCIADRLFKTLDQWEKGGLILSLPATIVHGALEPVYLAIDWLVADPLDSLLQLMAIPIVLGISTYDEVQQVYERDGCSALPQALFKSSKAALWKAMIAVVGVALHIMPWISLSAFASTTLVWLSGMVAIIGVYMLADALLFSNQQESMRPESLLLARDWARDCPTTATDSLSDIWMRFATLYFCFLNKERQSINRSHRETKEEIERRRTLRQARQAEITSRWTASQQRADLIQQERDSLLARVHFLIGQHESLEEEYDKLLQQKSAWSTTYELEKLELEISATGETAL